MQWLFAVTVHKIFQLIGKSVLVAAAGECLPTSWFSFQNETAQRDVYSLDSAASAMGRSSSMSQRPLGVHQHFLRHFLKYGDGSKPWYLVNPKIAGLPGCSSH